MDRRGRINRASTFTLCQPRAGRRFWATTSTPQSCHRQPRRRQARAIDTIIADHIPHEIPPGRRLDLWGIAQISGTDIAFWILMRAFPMGSSSLNSGEMTRCTWCIGSHESDAILPNNWRSKSAVCWMGPQSPRVSALPQLSRIQDRRSAKITERSVCLCNGNVALP